MFNYQKNSAWYGIAKICLAGCLVLLVAGGAIMLQIHITKVSAQMDGEVATTSTGHIPFGTVFPGENLADTFTVSYLGEGNPVEYRILQTLKPLPDESGYYKDLCPYLAKTSLDNEGDTEGLGGSATLDEIDNTDTWLVSLEVPAIIGQVAQDQAGGFISESGEYGCDITVAVLECSAAWQIGQFDNSNAEFGPVPFDTVDDGPIRFRINASTTIEFAKNIAGPDENSGGNLQTNEYNPTTIEFDLPNYSIANTYSLDLDIYDMQNYYGFQAGDGTIAFSISANGHVIYGFTADLPDTGEGVVDGTPSLETSIPIDPAFLAASANEIVIEVTDGDWIAVDALALNECVVFTGGNSVRLSSLSSGGGLSIFPNSAAGSGGAVVKGLAASGPNLSIGKIRTSRDVINKGDTGIEFEIIVTNNGDLAAFGVSLSDQLPPGFTFSGSSETARAWELGDIEPGQISTVRYAVDAGNEIGAGQYKNLVIASAENHDPVAAEAEIKVDIPSVLGIEYAELEPTGFSLSELLYIIFAALICLFAAKILDQHQKASSNG